MKFVEGNASVHQVKSVSPLSGEGSLRIHISSHFTGSAVVLLHLIRIIQYVVTGLPPVTLRSVRSGRIFQEK